MSGQLSPHDLSRPGAVTQLVLVSVFYSEPEKLAAMVKSIKGNWDAISGINLTLLIVNNSQMADRDLEILLEKKKHLDNELVVLGGPKNWLDARLDYRGSLHHAMGLNIATRYISRQGGWDWCLITDPDVKFTKWYFRILVRLFRGGTTVLGTTWDPSHITHPIDFPSPHCTAFADLRILSFLDFTCDVEYSQRVKAWSASLDLLNPTRFPLGWIPQLRPAFLSIYFKLIADSNRDTGYRLRRLLREWYSRDEIFLLDFVPTVKSMRIVKPLVRTRWFLFPSLNKRKKILINLIERYYKKVMKRGWVGERHAYDGEHVLFHARTTLENEK